jgi:hypothetical protein
MPNEVSGTPAAGPPRPRVISTDPLDDASGVGPATVIVIGFSEDMDPASTAGAFSITPSVTGGKIVVSDRTLRFEHTQPSSPGTHYTVVLTDQAESLEGMPLAANYTLDFDVASTESPGPFGTTFWGAPFLLVLLVLIVAVAVCAGVIIFRRRDRRVQSPKSAMRGRTTVSEPL